MNRVQRERAHLYAWDLFPKALQELIKYLYTAGGKTKQKPPPEDSPDKSSGLKGSFPQLVQRHKNKWETWNHSPKHETRGK